MPQENHHHQPYHKHVTLFLVVGLVGIGLLWFTVSTMQKLNHARVSGGNQPSPAPINTEHIIIDTPHMNDHVPQDVTVSGSTTLDRIGIRLRDKYSGHVITEVQAARQNGQPGQSSKFTTDLQITDDSIRSEAPIILEVFNPAGGKETEKITLPLTFTPIGQ